MDQNVIVGGVYRIKGSKHTGYVIGADFIDRQIMVNEVIHNTPVTTTYYWTRFFDLWEYAGKDEEEEG